MPLSVGKKQSFLFTILSNLLLEKWLNTGLCQEGQTYEINIFSNYWTARFEIFVHLLSTLGKGQNFFLACVSRLPFQQQHREDITHNQTLSLHGALSSLLIHTQSKRQLHRCALNKALSSCKDTCLSFCSAQHQPHCQHQKCGSGRELLQFFPIEKDQFLQKIIKDLVDWRKWVRINLSDTRLLSWSLTWQKRRVFYSSVQNFLETNSELGPIFCPYCLWRQLAIASSLQACPDQTTDWDASFSKELSFPRAGDLSAILHCATAFPPQPSVMQSKHSWPLCSIRVITASIRTMWHMPRQVTWLTEHL